MPLIAFTYGHKKPAHRFQNGVRVANAIADESTMPIIDNEKHRTEKGYMWCVRDAVEGNLFFHYDMGSRSARTAMKLLKDYQGGDPERRV